MAIGALAPDNALIDAVGSEPFVTETRELLGFNGRGRVVPERDGAFEL